MSSELNDLIDESIALELNVSDLYMVFYKLFPEDETFWWALLLEEKAHAALFKSGKKILNDLKIFPEKLLHHNLDDLKTNNKELVLLVETLKNSPPSRRKAFETALEIENTVAEMHFQLFMAEEAESELAKQFKDLNKKDKDHIFRIEAYIKAQSI